MPRFQRRRWKMELVGEDGKPLDDVDSTTMGKRLERLQFVTEV
jgi:hypothetical protein